MGAGAFDAAVRALDEIEPTTDHESDITEIASMFKQTKGFDEDVQLFRGLGYKAWWDLDATAIGTVIQDGAFISTANIESFSANGRLTISRPTRPTRSF